MAVPATTDTFADVRSKRVLYVDDDEPMRYASCRFLQAAGFQVIEAADSRGALDVIAAQRIHLVITDYRLGPGQPSGTELAAEIRRRRPEVPILLVSATTSEPRGLEHVDRFVRRFECRPEEIVSVAKQLLAPAPD